MAESIDRRLLKLHFMQGALVGIQPINAHFDSFFGVNSNVHINFNHNSCFDTTKFPSTFLNKCTTNITYLQYDK